MHRFPEGGVSASCIQNLRALLGQLVDDRLQHFVGGYPVEPLSWRLLIAFVPVHMVAVVNWHSNCLNLYDDYRTSNRSTPADDFLDQLIIAIAQHYY